MPSEVWSDMRQVCPPLLLEHFTVCVCSLGPISALRSGSLGRKLWHANYNYNKTLPSTES
jgi:hypothetical protein